jgi:arginase
MTRNERIRIIGVPIDLGASRRGANLGPSALRAADVGPQLRELGLDVDDIGDIRVPDRESIGEDRGNEKARFLPQIASVAALVKREVHRSLKDGRVPLVLGGDHSFAIGSVAGVAGWYRARGEKIGMLWVDAHGDLSTPETTVTGNIHGMPAAHILGRGAPELLAVGDEVPMVDPSRVAQIFIRHMNPPARDLVEALGVRVFTMRSIDETGLCTAIREAVKIVTAGTVGFHLSLDVDCMDPGIAPGTGTRVLGGATYREARLAMEIAHDSGKLLSMDVAEVNPLLDISNQTADLAVEMVLSAFGKLRL